MASFLISTGAYDILLIYTFFRLFKEGNAIGLQFPNGIYLTYPSKNTFNWSRLDFRPNLHKISDLVEILSQFPSVMDIYRKEDVPFQNIKSIEINFDLPILQLKQRGHELVANNIKNFIIPKIPKRCFYIKYEGEDNFSCTDGAINGTSSYYFHSATNISLLTKINPHENYRGCESVIYTKYNPEYNNWVIRFEIRIKNKKVKDMLNFSNEELPHDLLRILSKAEDREFKDSFYFIKLDYEQFLKDRKLLLSRKTEPSFKWLERQGLGKPPAHTLMIMNRIDKLLLNKKLKKKNKDYITRISNKNYEKYLNKYIEYLISNKIL